MKAPAHTDGGDIFPVGKYIFIGQSTRTNDEAFEQMKKFTAGHHYIDDNGNRHAYECVRLPVKGRLHTKTAGSFLTDHSILMDTKACDPSIFTSRGIEVFAAP
uniref:N(G),N(G)-dimethylarginine dimethylaminohydrolase n=1 Tax=Lygus hesperus TaxID=30085 RepID=A0A0A9YUG1_LYGHE